MNDATRSALWSMLWTFLSVFSTTALGWLQRAAEWASTSGRTPLPGISVLGYGAVSAAVAAVTGAIVFLFRTGQAKGLIKGTPPKFDK